MFERTWLSEMMKGFVQILEGIEQDEEGKYHSRIHGIYSWRRYFSNSHCISYHLIEKIAYCERFMEFLIDLEAQLPTRRYFNTLVEDHQIVAICKLSKFASNKESGVLFSQLLDILAFYTGFEINGHSGLALTKEEMTEIHAARLSKLQVKTESPINMDVVLLAKA